MPRTHIVQSWIGAAEYDEGDTYSGEQIGNRNQKSIGVLIERSGDQWKAGGVSQEIPTFINGRANVAAFADPCTKPKQVRTKSAFDSIMLADRNYERLCGLSEKLDQEFDAGQIDLESWAAARKNIDQRLTKAWSRVQRERGWDNQNELLEPEQYPSQPLDFTLDFEAKTQRQYDYSVIPSGSVFAELDDGNIFKKFYVGALTAYKALAKIAVTTKHVLEEGLV